MCPVPLKWQILDVFPPGTVWELYGATEAMGTVISPGEWILKPGSVGRPFPGLSVRVLNDAGEQAAPGEVGTIYVSQFPGARFSYRGDVEKTEAAYRDDFVTVGDLGHLDENGYLYIADRRTDLILSGGVNIYPAEVENALAADPDVLDSAVIGLDDERMGQRVHAVIELRAGCGGRPGRHPRAIVRASGGLQVPADDRVRRRACPASPTARSSSASCAKSGRPAPELGRRLNRGPQSDDGRGCASLAGKIVSPIESVPAPAFVQRTSTAGSSLLA